uniref:NADH dehydrogenase subunit 4 n=1 Tax=Kuphus polythalamius TaxID=1049060 RepID=UPI002027CB77|nr:NADH dehydrogenase subunit 4 [Kuphus polythalamius]UPX89191.1 NADH dehydrogenase subunit 4 [Kuphus polythalamius]UPX89203.1 NADH dehydrogenase subunit 4 [Kuphus polythalamius]
MAFFEFFGVAVVGVLLLNGGSIFILGFGVCYLLVVAEFFVRPLVGCQFGELVLMDSLSVLLVVMSLLVGVMSLMCSSKDFNVSSFMGKKGIEVPVLLVLGFSIGAFISSSWLGFFVCFEGSLLPMLWMILIWGYQPERLQAGVYMVLYTVCGSLPLLVSLLWLGSVISTDVFMVAKMSCWFCFQTAGLSLWVVFGLMAGFMVKFPLYLVHGWLPKAHVEAPLAGSMILSGVLLKLGSFGLYRVMWLVNLKGGEFYGKVFVYLVIVVGLLGGCLCNLYCLCQSDLKSMVAYSSVGHMGLCLCGLLSGVSLGHAGAACMMFSHGLCSPILFALAGALHDWSDSRSIVLNKGLNSVFPVFSLFWSVAWFVNMGIPLSLNFMAEWMLISSVGSISCWLLPFGWLSCFLSGAAAFYAYGAVCHGVVSDFSRSFGVGISSRYFYGGSFGFVFLLLGSLGLDFFVC